MTSGTAVFLLISLLVLSVVFSISYLILKKIGRDPKNILPRNFAKRIQFPLILLMVAIILQIGLARNNVFTNPGLDAFISQLRSLLFVFSITWFIVVAIRIAKKRILRRFDVTLADNLRARKYYTQFNILERILVAIVIVFAIGVALMTFDGIREIGVSVITSAGIAGIILGLSAQKAIGTLLAGIQIAITQPIRLDDVVIVEGEWGKIEEIRLTYVVVKIWDQRRMVLPTTYFIEKPFQNWTRNTSEILGTVFLHTDYNVPVNELRKELTRLLESSPLWDGKVNVLQVTDASEKSMELRALMSAKDSGTAFDLRVYVREKLLEFLRTNYPESLPVERVEIHQQEFSQHKNPKNT